MSGKRTPSKPVIALANAVAEAGSSDVRFLNGDVERHIDDELIALVRDRRRHKNVLLMLVTPGGNADAAYRIARCLQDSYEKFTVFVSGYCKSAGTLCVLGAHELVMADCAELGPLDVQFYKKDELGELASGLVLPEALEALRDNAFQMFESYMLDIKKRSANLITFKTATDVAVKMAVGLYEPIFRQMDPMQIGELNRSMSVARAYGERLRVKSANFDQETLRLLIGTYPSHSFVIDRREAELLFEHVRTPTAEETVLTRELGHGARFPVAHEDGATELLFLSDELPETKDGKDDSDETGPKDGDSGTRNKGAPADTGGAEAQKGAAVSGQDVAHVQLVKG